MLSLPPLTLNAWLRYDVIERMLQKLDRVESVLEIGMGQGAMGTRLAQRFTYEGLEVDVRSFTKARARLEQAGRGRALLGDESALQADETFDVVCAFEVLEHIEDDVAALSRWRLLLRPGGWLILSVPAFSRRYGAWDRKAGHYRRYDREETKNAVVAAGFGQPLIQTYGFPLGNVLESIRNLVALRDKQEASMGDRTLASGGLLQPPEELGWLTRILSIPFRTLQRPFLDRDWGTGFVVLARRLG